MELKCCAGMGAHICGKRATRAFVVVDQSFELYSGGALSYQMFAVCDEDFEEQEKVFNSTNNNRSTGEPLEYCLVSL